MPFTTVKFTFEPLAAPLNQYALLPSFITLNVFGNSSNGMGLADDETIKLPLIVVNVFTTNPLFGEIDAVAEPLAIKFESNASSVKAERGISDNPNPLPLKNPPPIGIVILPLTEILPLKVEPLAIEVTNKPVSGATEAVTLPLAIRNTSLANADCGISNNPLPLPLNIDADTVFVKNDGTFTLNP